MQKNAVWSPDRAILAVQQRALWRPAAFPGWSPTCSLLTAVLIERAQFAQNKKIYDPAGFKGEIDFEGSWLDWFLFETESFHGKLSRSAFCLPS